MELQAVSSSELRGIDGGWGVLNVVGAVVGGIAGGVAGGLNYGNAAGAVAGAISGAVNGFEHPLEQAPSTDIDHTA